MSLALRAWLRAGWPRAWLRLAVALVVAASVASATRDAHAHAAGLSRSEITASGAIVTATLTFARRDVAWAAPELDADHDGAITAIELDAGHEALRKTIVDRLEVRGDGVACAAQLVDAALVEEDGLRVAVRAQCAGAPRELQISLAFLGALPFGHRHLAHVTGASGPFDAVLSRTSLALSVAPSTPASAGPTAAAVAPAAPSRGLFGLFWMGVEHILTGYDHLAFLLGLVIVGSRPRELLLVVSAFTVGHSISLAVATLGVWTPSARLVEPAIALSIVFVGVENLRLPPPTRRWRLTLPFGLVHGFGFASALRDLSLPRAELPAALALFNLGVEAGQLAALALVLPLVYAASRSERLQARGTQAVSVAIACAGGVWFVARVFGG